MVMKLRVAYNGIYELVEKAAAYFEQLTNFSGRNRNFNMTLFTRAAGIRISSAHNLNRNAS